MIRVNYASDHQSWIEICTFYRIMEVRQRPLLELLHARLFFQQEFHDVWRLMQRGVNQWQTSWSEESYRFKWLYDYCKETGFLSRSYSVSSVIPWSSCVCVWLYFWYTMWQPGTVGVRELSVCQGCTAKCAVGWWNLTKPASVAERVLSKVHNSR